MVNRGSKSLPPLRCFSVRIQGDRVRLPAPVLEAKQALLAGTEAIECWLLVVTPGRYRLLFGLGDGAAGPLVDILQQAEEAVAPGDILDNTENNELAAVQARLLPTTASPRGPGWRVHIPKEARDLVPEKEERSFVFVLVVAGFIELWFPDTLRRSLSTPVTDVLR